MASCLSPPAVARLVQAVGERRIAEIRKSAAADRDVERSVAAVRHLSLPRRPAHRYHGLGHGGDALGDVPKPLTSPGSVFRVPRPPWLDPAPAVFGTAIDHTLSRRLFPSPDRPIPLPAPVRRRSPFG